MDASKVLITGAAGFIGSFLAEKFIKEDYYVVGVDNLFRGKKENLSTLMKSPKFEFVTLDLTKDIPKTLFNDVEAVFHYAAVNGTEYFYEKPLFTLDVNTRTTINLLKSIESAESVEKVVYASSSEVYGNPLYFPTDEKHPILLPEVENSRHSYAASKAIGEFYVNHSCNSSGIKYLILRIFNTYGPRMDTSKYGQVIPEFIRKFFFDDEFTIIGDGSQTRSFNYIEDHVEATYLAFRKAENEILNVGSNEEVTIKHLAELIFDIGGKEFKFKSLPPRSGDPPRRVPNIEKLLSITNYKTRYDLRKGLEKTMKWYIKKWGIASSS